MTYPAALELAVVAVILSFGALVQSAVGFGIGLVAVPLLVMTGHEVPDAVALVLGAAAVQTVYGSIRQRKEIRLRMSLSVGVFQWLFLPVGVFGMEALVGQKVVTIKQLVGLAVIGVTLTQLLIKPRPRDAIARPWRAVAGSISGTLSGLIGMGGPPLVYFALAHGWTRDRFRAFLWTQFLISLPVLLALMTYHFGSQVPAAFGIGVAMAPVVFGAAVLGIRITARWERQQLYRAAVVLLFAIGASSVASPLLLR